ncbi:hypothetical protein KFL_002430030 [Klebsormidium nitens]|uniref:Uncharacterized protein n=1 Tax=Klebsormidium nitens TaxID=105231 RepID=A0A1Y1IA46_KLENI|nr:hypothetical protein KFL_002430030 [Klebsormidium nitens]|eukprot:GAQ85587.1 hypothetical protein KFL_002430030 [Klebsormidium nitens]
MRGAGPLNVGNIWRKLQSVKFSRKCFMAALSSVAKNLGTYMPIGTTTVYSVLVPLVFSNETGAIDSVCNFDKVPVAASTRGLLSLIIAVLGVICMLAPFVVFNYGADPAYSFLLWQRTTTQLSAEAARNEANIALEQALKDWDKYTEAVGAFNSEVNALEAGSTLQEPFSTKREAVHDLKIIAEASRKAADRAQERANTARTGQVSRSAVHYARSALSITAFLTFALLSPSSTSCLFKGKIPDSVVRVLPIVVGVVLAVVAGFLPAPKPGEAWPFDAPSQGTTALPLVIAAELKKQKEDALKQIQEAADAATQSRTAPPQTAEPAATAPATEPERPNPSRSQSELPDPSRHPSELPAPPRPQSNTATRATEESGTHVMNNHLSA